MDVFVEDDSARLVKAVIHNQRSRMGRGWSSLARHATVRTRYQSSDYDAERSFGVRAYKKVFRVLRAEVTQTNAYSDAWRAARSASIVFGALTRIKKLKQSRGTYHQQIKQAAEIHHHTLAASAMQRMKGNAQYTLDSAVRERMAELFHRKYRALATLYRMKMLNTRNACHRCTKEAMASQRAQAHYISIFFHRWMADARARAIRRAVRIQRHRAALHTVLHQWGGYVAQRVMSKHKIVVAAKSAAKAHAARALSHWGFVRDVHRRLHIQRARSIRASNLRLMSTSWRAITQRTKQRVIQRECDQAAQYYYQSLALQSGLQALQQLAIRLSHVRAHHEYASKAHCSRQLRRGFKTIHSWQRSKRIQLKERDTTLETAVLVNKSRRLSHHLQMWKVQTVKHRLERSVTARCQLLCLKRLAKGFFRRVKLRMRQTQQQSVVVFKSINQKILRFQRQTLRLLQSNRDTHRGSHLCLLKSTRLWKYRRLFRGLHALLMFTRCRKMYVQMRLQAVRLRRNALLKEGVRRMLAMDTLKFHMSKDAVLDTAADRATLLHAVFSAWKRMRRQNSPACAEYIEAMPASFNYLPDYSHPLTFLPSPAARLSLIPPADPLAREPPRTASWLDGPTVHRVVKPSTPEMTAIALATSYKFSPPLVQQLRTPARPVKPSTEHSDAQLRIELAAAIMQFVSDVRSQIDEVDLYENASGVII